MSITVNEIKNLSGDDLNHLKKHELIEIAKASTRNTKQRLGQLKKAGIESTPATRKLEKNLGDLEMPTNKDLESMKHNDLKKLVADTRDFLRGQTSTVKGERQRIRNFVELAVDKKGKSKKSIENTITRKIKKIGGYDKLGDVFDLIEQIEELEPSLVYELGSGTEDETGFIGTIIEAYTNKDFKALLNDPVAFKEKLRSQIDELQRKKNEFEF